MKGDCDEYIGRDLFRRCRRTETPPRKINTLLSDLLEKEEEIAMYKSRLKELETAFYYNLDLISERDLEIGVLEKQLRSEIEQQEAIIRERDELEELVKVMDEKKNRKIQQLETKLALKEDEIRELQRDNLGNVNALKKMMNDLKSQQDKKMYKLSSSYEFRIKELVKNFQEEMEEKEKYYLIELDNLTGKLEQARREKETLHRLEKEYRNLKFHLEDVETLFQEKENYYLQEIRRVTKSPMRKINREVQCGFTNNQLQGIDRNVQAEPDRTPAECQTRATETEAEYKKKITFLEEQNEVLKCVIKEMKKNKSEAKGEEKASGCECPAVEMMEKVNKKFEGEINNLKKILEEEKRQRKEEEAAIQSLESSVTCLKDKLLTGLQEKVQKFSGEDCGYPDNHESRVTLVEEKLGKKIDAVIMAAEEERRKVYERLEEVKKECAEKMETFAAATPRQEIKSENLLEKIRLEMEKLEGKIEGELKSFARNNAGEKHGNIYRETGSADRGETSFHYRDKASDLLAGPSRMRGIYFRNDFEFDKSANALKALAGHRVENQVSNVKLGEERGYGKMRNDLTLR